MSVIVCPGTLTEAMALSAKGYRVLAGGSDLYPALGPDLRGDFIDLMTLPDLQGITHTSGLRTGACTTGARLPRPTCPPP